MAGHETNLVILSFLKNYHNVDSINLMYSCEVLIFDLIKYINSDNSLVRGIYIEGKI